MADFIAIYAAILSTIVFIWNVRSSRSKITVHIIHALRGKQSGVVVHIRNPSTRAVHITNVSLLYQYRKMPWAEWCLHIVKYRRFNRYIGWVHSYYPLEGLKTGLPKIVEPNDAHDIFISERRLRKMLEADGATVFAAYAQDALWRGKYSSSFQMWKRP